LKAKYKELGIDSEKVFDRIKDIIVKTLIAVEAPMQSVYASSYDNRNNFYELYGFDVLIDEKLNPWLIEVNVCPSLNNSTPLDRKIKTTMLCDILNMLGFTPYDKK
jgi:tubulin polyglutamylase TTLL4